MCLIICAMRSGHNRLPQGREDGHLSLPDKICHRTAAQAANLMGANHSCLLPQPTSQTASPRKARAPGPLMERS